MKNIGYLLLVLYLVFAGVDRINFGGNSIESFKLLPHIILSLLIILFIVLFKISEINFNWISSKKSLSASSKIKESMEVENDIGDNYIEIAEKIIAQEQVSRTTAKITLLEAIRHINKIKPDKNLSYYTSRLI